MLLNIKKLCFLSYSTYLGRILAACADSKQRLPFLCFDYFEDKAVLLFHGLKSLLSLVILDLQLVLLGVRPDLSSSPCLYDELHLLPIVSILVKCYN